MDATTECLTGVKVRKSDGILLRQELACHLTLREQETILRSSAVLSTMGHGCGTEIMEQMVEEVLNQKVGERERAKASEAVLKLMRRRFPEVGSLRMGASLDPKQAEKATEDTRDTVFVKLDNFIHLLCRMGVSQWKSHGDIPPELKCNMDELGTDMTKRRSKVFLPPSLL